MVRTFAVFVTVLVVGLVVGLVGGCGGTPDASPPTSPSPSASPTASATPTAPVMPDAARENTKAGAVAFVRHYVDLINHAQATGETQALAAASETACRSCAQVRLYLTNLYRSGGRFEGGRARVIDVVDAVSPARFGDYAIDVLVDIAPSKVIGPGGKKTRAKGAKNVLGFYPKWHSVEWKVAQWTRAK